MLNSAPPSSSFRGQRTIVGILRTLLVNRYTLFLLFLTLYTALVEQLGGLNGGWTFLSHQYFEIALLFYIYWYLNAVVRPSRWQAFLAAAPILLAYIGQDIYYLLLGKVFRFVELTEVKELLNVTSTTFLALIVLAAVITFCGMLWCINYRRPKAIVLGLLPLVLVVAATQYSPEKVVRSYRLMRLWVVNWSDEMPVELNGRFVMLVYREAERRISLNRTATFQDRPAYELEARKRAEWLKKTGSKRNVHLVVMESFVDPTLFKGAIYTRDPVHPDFRRLFGDRMGFSVSPVFGGKTSQAEFEVLCGVPAFQELAGVEFNSFTGVPAYCLPGTLQLAGYRTVATNSFKPTFFNAVSAYEGIGFGEMYFPREYVDDATTYLSTGDTTGEIYMFDGELFRQNLQFVEEALSDKDAPPLFNYVLTMFGHLPYVLNQDKRPYLLKLLSRYRDPTLERVANLFYYRSQAVAAYVKRLVKIDPHSLIILVSDHVPPLQGLTTYKKLRYLDNRKDSLHLNRILFIEDGKVKTHATIHHYDVPKIILDYLSQGQYCRENLCGFAKNRLLSDRDGLRDEYLRLMAHAID
ncbi:MAG: LTA synthase family protein [Desulfoprunum sp.]|uniref:LTA synthase family protein n=1 Tax=Desulfoprunum sp. TaxID=2020866 RepID=UPI003C741DB4